MNDEARIHAIRTIQQMAHMENMNGAIGAEEAYSEVSRNPTDDKAFVLGYLVIKRRYNRMKMNIETIGLICDMLESKKKKIENEVRSENLDDEIDRYERLIRTSNNIKFQYEELLAQRNSLKETKTAYDEMREFIKCRLDENPELREDCEHLLISEITEMEMEKELISKDVE